MATLDQEHQRVRSQRLRTTIYQAAVVLCGIALAVGLSRWLETKRPPIDTKQEEEKLYVTGKTLNRASIGLGAVVADWYWMRSLQYVGRKILDQKDDIPIDDLKKLNLTLLYPLLDTTTTLDPQFIAAYEYGGVVLPAIDQPAAIKLLEKGIAANPNSWRLYQHLGYIYWKQGDYATASRHYKEGSTKPGAPAWLEAMAARVLADGGGRETAREMYQHMIDQSGDESVRDMARKRIAQIDSFYDRDVIRPALAQYRERNGGKCPATWRDAQRELRAAKVMGKYSLSFDANGDVIDPLGTPYLLVQDDCSVDIDWKNSKVPYK